jgi:HSP20 family molecular chaperone IbpA
MAEETRDLQVEEVRKEELVDGDVERTRSRRCFVPRVDIYETSEDIFLAADMPGVNDKSVDITWPLWNAPTVPSSDPSPCLS